MGKGNGELSNKEGANKVMNSDSLPYYMTNRKWYKINYDLNSSRGHLLTEEGKKTPRAVESYERAYKDGYLLYDGDLDDGDVTKCNNAKGNSVELHGINKPDRANPDTNPDTNRTLSGHLSDNYSFVLY